MCDRAITRTDIGKNDVLTVLLDSHGLVDEFGHYEHRFWPIIGNLMPINWAEKCQFYVFWALRRSLPR